MGTGLPKLPQQAKLKSMRMRRERPNEERPSDSSSVSWLELRDLDKTLLLLHLQRICTVCPMQVLVAQWVAVVVVDLPN